VTNPSRATVKITFLDVRASLGGIEAGNVVLDSTRTVGPRDDSKLDAEIGISSATMQKLRAAGEVNLRITGGMKLTASFLWVKMSRRLPEGVGLERRSLFG